MKSKIKQIFAIIFLGLFLATSFSHAALVNCGNSLQDDPTTANINEGPCQWGDLFFLAYGLINFALSISGLIALCFILWGGLQMIIAGGNPTKIEEGKTTLKNAITGFVLILTSYLILGYVVSLLVPNSTADPLLFLKSFLP